MSFTDDGPRHGRDAPTFPAMGKRKKRRRSLRSSNAGLIGLIVLVVIGLFVIQYFRYAEHTTTVTVCQKERAAKGNSGEYRIHTAQSGTYIIKDTRWIGQWRTDSADAYGQLRTPGTYRVTYVGWRFSLLSWFRNIVGYERVADDAAQVATCRASLA